MRFIAVLLAPTMVLGGSQHTNVPLEHFCNRSGHTSTRYGDAVYVYGGTGGRRTLNSTSAYDRALIKLDFSYSWDVLLNEQPASFIGSLNDSSAPPSRLMGAGLFYDTSDTFYIYGGRVETSNVSVKPIIPAEAPSTFWTLANESRSWYSSSIELPNLKFASSQMIYAHAPDQDLVAYLNGIPANSSNEHGSSRMIIFNTRTKEYRSVAAEATSQSTIRASATFLYLPLLGKKGALVLFGGSHISPNNMTSDSWGTMASLDTIHIFDIASLDTSPNGNWYTQRTSGRTPAPRLETCAVSIISPDNTNYHIYISSGRSPATIHDDVWVLSLPQFRWTQVFRGERPNYGSTCHLFGNKQMVVLGGVDIRLTCAVPPYVALYDMTNLKWLRSFVKDDEEFRVPKAVWEGIDGSPMGEAKMRAPQGGFMDAGLASMFEGMQISPVKTSVSDSRCGYAYQWTIYAAVVCTIALFW